jgi:putative thiamine transport system ATP-binding protein
MNTAQGDLDDPASRGLSAAPGRPKPPTSPPGGSERGGLVLRDVTIRLEGRTLVAIERLDVAAGSVTAVMGPSGSGKSSLLAWMTGLLEPPLEGAGAISVSGVELSALPTEARKLGLMQQDDVLFPHLSVLENVRSSRST